MINGQVLAGKGMFLDKRSCLATGFERVCYSYFQGLKVRIQSNF